MSQWLSLTRMRVAPRGERALDRGVRLGRHQPARSVILRGMPRISRIGLILVGHAGHAFHVDGDVDPHDASERWTPATANRGNDDVAMDCGRHAGRRGRGLRPE